MSEVDEPFVFVIPNNFQRFPFFVHASKAAIPHGIPWGHYPCLRPSAGPHGRTLAFLGGPCLIATSWPALPWFAFAHSRVTGRGGNCFGSFCRNKRTSAAGPKPGISDHSS
ncbi:MAG TPA: hypothetical protein DD706_04490 [Nitrospiraceae bacterium]|nr:hypothetical protein [Nitrospiraceae bacterium]